LAAKTQHIKALSYFRSCLFGEKIATTPGFDCPEYIYSLNAGLFKKSPKNAPVFLRLEL
jgi:hypothetical protein